MAKLYALLNHSYKSFYILILLIPLIFICNCNSPYSFKRNTKLMNDYKYTQRDDDFIFYYNLEHSDGIKIVSLAIKNVSGDFMSNLSMVFYNNDKSKYNRYIGLGDVKNRSVKYVTLEIPDNLMQINIKYEYIPLNEDSFLFSNTEENYSTYTSRITKEIILYIP